MDGLADLHLHSTLSDGAHAPEEVLRLASEAGLRTVSLTDHDTVDGVADAIELGKGLELEVIPGVELSAATDATEVHILGYFLNYRAPCLLEALATFREQRVRRAERIVDKLNQLNIPISMEAVLANASGMSVGRPHIATALVTEGHIQSYYEAFNKYIGDGRPAYERKSHFTPEETVRLIADSGGLSFLAHPARQVSEEILTRLIRAGLDGIEVIHPSHTSDLVRYYRGIASEYCLLESGGSDFHGGHRSDDHVLGQYGVSPATVDIMRNRLFSK